MNQSDVVIGRCTTALACVAPLIRWWNVSIKEPSCRSSNAYGMSHRSDAAVRHSHEMKWYERNSQENTTTDFIWSWWYINSIIPLLAVLNSNRTNMLNQVKCWCHVIFVLHTEGKSSVGNYVNVQCTNMGRLWNQASNISCWVEFENFVSTK